MNKNVLITGAARRIGASCARMLHDKGCNVILQYRSSKQDAELLGDELNQKRPNSARLIQTDLLTIKNLETLAQQAISTWGGIDVLINNAAAFYPTPLAQTTEAQWDDLLGNNLKAPFFLSKALSENLTDRHGCIINIADIHAERGMPNYAIYSISKAGLVAMTKILAKEFAPLVRVNAIAPGAIIWPENGLTDQAKNEILQRIPLARCGLPGDIAKAVLYLTRDADYVTGQTITVDGGRTLFY